MQAMKGIYRALLLLALAAFMPAAAADGPDETAENGPALPESVQALNPERPLQLLGSGSMRKLIWDVFDASLWVAGDGWSLQQPFALELRYARDFDGEDIVKSTLDQWRHLGYTDTAKMEAWHQRIQSLFPDVRARDQLVGFYRPGGATHFFHNGRALGTVEDPAFGPAFFAIWLDPKTSQPGLRRALLGDGCPEQATQVAAAEQECSGAKLPRHSPPS